MSSSLSTMYFAPLGVSMLSPAYLKYNTWVHAGGGGTQVSTCEWAAMQQEGVTAAALCGLQQDHNSILVVPHQGTFGRVRGTGSTREWAGSRHEGMTAAGLCSLPTAMQTRSAALNSQTLEK
jgi:hypothetical protein